MNGLKILAVNDFNLPESELANVLKVCLVELVVVLVLGVIDLSKYDVNAFENGIGHLHIERGVQERVLVVVYFVEILHLSKDDFFDLVLPSGATVEHVTDVSIDIGPEDLAMGHPEYDE